MSAATSCHSSPQVSLNSGGAGISASNSPRARGGSVRRLPWRGERSRADDPQAGEEVVSHEVLERLEAVADRAHIDLTIEGAHRPAQADVAGRPGARSRQVAREEPVGSPLAEAAQRGQLRLDLLVRQRGQTLEVEVGTGEADQVLGFATREADGDDLVLGRPRDPLAGRKRVGVLGTLAEALDQP